MSNINIAIDGPAAAGKSTIAKYVASCLSYKYLDTGAMYRAATLYYLNHNTTFEESSLDSLNINFGTNGEVFLNHIDVTKEIRSNEVTKMVSEVASLQFVRNYLVTMQQEIAKEKKVVMDGRDIGTVVLPQAELKIFMTASPEVRAKRRLKEEDARGNNISLETLIEDIRARDYSDINRIHSPLKQAKDAIMLDTDQLTIKEVTKKIVTLAHERMEN